MSPPTWSGFTWSVNGTVKPITISFPSCTSGIILILAPSNMGSLTNWYTNDSAPCSIFSVKILQSLQYLPLISNIVVFFFFSVIRALFTMFILSAFFNTTCSLFGESLATVVFLTYYIFLVSFYSDYVSGIITQFRHRSRVDTRRTHYLATCANCIKHDFLANIHFSSFTYLLLLRAKSHIIYHKTN